ncbi:MAG: hypothetical protein D3903_18250 [Candidatus Electrothrix sp. GM3_4]|nr:hypothetical protein [Candidatus Electrothrix sp. GM3_4]
MLSKKMKYAKEVGKSMLAVHSGEYVLLLFMCLFFATFLVATVLFLATGDEMIFVQDMQIPFVSSIFR